MSPCAAFMSFIVSAAIVGSSAAQAWIFMTTLINSSALKPCSVKAGAMSCWTFGRSWSIFCICLDDASPGEFSMSWIVFVSESLLALNWANAASKMARAVLGSIFAGDGAGGGVTVESTGFALNCAALALRRAPRVRFQRAWSFVFWDCWAVHVSRAALSENRAVSFASPASYALTFFSVHWSQAAWSFSVHRVKSSGDHWGKSSTGLDVPLILTSSMMKIKVLFAGILGGLPCSP
mmetsp:Transcript_4079/g.11622  ORF Transcript_4079/g.11622 Transcript_4079/m.11622 type:complete len:236 (-) Transcript_4079:535-1242(-)